MRNNYIRINKGNYKLNKNRKIKSNKLFNKIN